MKNWKLWLVVGLLFLATAITFFVLWYKEKKNKAELAERLSKLPKTRTVTTGGGHSAEANEEPSVNETVTEVAGTGRSVSQATPTMRFGS